MINILKKYKFEISLAVGLLITILTGCAFAWNDAKDIKDSIVRMHIIANSDSKEDQALKLKVRDEILSLATQLTKDANNAEEILDILSNNTELLEKTAGKVVIDSGYDYTVAISTERNYFPTKNYGELTLPAGKYNALRVELGDASGENFWCVIFPPLCLNVAKETEIDINKEFDNIIDEQQAALILNNNDDNRINIKFKVVEVMAKGLQWLGIG